MDAQPGHELIVFGVSGITGETQEAIDRRHDPERETSLDAGSCDIGIRTFIGSQRDDLTDPRKLGSREHDRCFVHGAEQLTRQDLHIHFGVGVRIGPTWRVGHLEEADEHGRPSPLRHHRLDVFRHPIAPRQDGADLPARLATRP